MDDTLEICCQLVDPLLVVVGGRTCDKASGDDRSDERAETHENR